MFLGTVLDQLPLCAQKQQTNQNFKLSSFTAKFFSSFFLLDLQKIFRLLLYSFHFFNSICKLPCYVFLIFILVFIMKHEFKHLTHRSGRPLRINFMSRYICFSQIGPFDVSFEELFSKAKNPGGFFRKIVF